MTCVKKLKGFIFFIYICTCISVFDLNFQRRKGKGKGKEKMQGDEEADKKRRINDSKKVDVLYKEMMKKYEFGGPDPSLRLDISFPYLTPNATSHDLSLDLAL